MDCDNTEIYRGKTMFRFFVYMIMSVLIFSVFGCGRTDLNQPIVSEDIISDIIVDSDVFGNIIDDLLDTPKTDFESLPDCNIGDILMPGESCHDVGTDAVFTVLENGNGKYTSDSGLLFESTDILDTYGSTLNDRSYFFKAIRISGNSWKVEKEDESDFD